MKSVLDTRMENCLMDVPVMICGFNRPETLGRVVDALRHVKPSRLYFVLDAPRDGNQSDTRCVEECKKIFGRKFDWPCKIYRNYAEKNMGCGKRMTSGISWVFEHEDRAIILEDDCVPHPSFFQFCDELLERYKDDSRVGMIAAECEHFRKTKMNFYGDSYYFDRMCLVWGWATWARAWKLHDPMLKVVDRMVETDVMMNVFGERKYVKRWSDNIMRIRAGKRSTWAAAWATTLYRENMLVAHSVANPVVNVGQRTSSRAGVSGDVFPSPGEMNIVRCEQYCLEDMLYMSKWRKTFKYPRITLNRIWKALCR